MNKKMTVLGGLLMAVVVTGYSVAGTFAKYTTTDSYADKARAAEFNFTIGKTSEAQADLFGTTYANVNTVNLAGIASENTVVASKNTEKVVAPGTFGQYDFSINGTAEVNYVLEVDATINNGLKLADGYSPIKFALVEQGETAKPVTDVTDAEWKSEADIVTDLKALSSDKVVAANTETDKSYTLFWKWDFSTSAENDKKDTDIANLLVADTSEGAAEGATVKPELNVKLTVTAVQSNQVAGTTVTPVVPPVTEP